MKTNARTFWENNCSAESVYNKFYKFIEDAINEI
jgi:hypothetical protein